MKERQKEGEDISALVAYHERRRRRQDEEVGQLAKHTIRIKIRFLNNSDNFPHNKFMENNIIGKMLKSFRELEELTKSGLAKKISVDEKSIRDWESGKSTPSIKACWKLADFFDVSLDELVGRKFK